MKIIRSVLSVFLCLMLHAHAFAQSCNISTMAGTGYATYCCDGGPAIAAQISNPTGVAVDAAGNVYIADQSNNRIRKVTASGVISTFAGDSLAGFSGDGGPATAASLNSPSAVAVDVAGNVYISDASNNRIRKVNTSGTISTIAGTGTSGFSGDGGAATGADLFNPSGIAVDGSGTIFIADCGNNRIRKINTGGIISTFAGSSTQGFGGDGGAATSAYLYSPTGVALDAPGNVYICDWANQRIRKVNTGGIISTVAGHGAFGFSGDGGPAISATLWNPYGIAVDGSANIYIADNGNERIRMVNGSGTISTVAGNGTQSFSGDGGPAISATMYNPTGIAVDASGNMFIADNGNLRVRKVNTSGVISTLAGNGTVAFNGDGGPAISSEMNSPAGLARDTAGNLYIADMANNRVRKINTGGVISTFAGGGSSLGDGGPATSAQLHQPYGLAADKSGNIYIADQLNNRVRKVNTLGIISTVAGTGVSGFSGDGGLATSANLFAPSGVAVDTMGNLFIALGPDNRVRKVNSGGYITTLAGTGVPGYSGDGGPGTSAHMNNPNGVAVDKAGNVYIADEYNNRIRVVNSGGVISTFAGTGTAGYTGDGYFAYLAELNAPGNVAVDAAGNVYIADFFNNVVRRVDDWSGIHTIAGNGSAGFSGDGGPATAAKLNTPQGLATDPSWNVYIADRANNRIRKVAACPAGITEHDAIIRASVYPNPSQGLFTVQLTGMQGEAVLEIYNLLGQSVHKTLFTGEKAELDLRASPKGIYFYRILSGNKLVASGKVVID